MSKKKLAIVTTHPIQYHAPLFKLLAEEGKMQVKVFYTFSQSQKGKQYDLGFGKLIEWDIPLLDGYDYTFIKNVSKKPGTYHFNGIVNPDLVKIIEEWNPDGLLIFGWSFKSHLACMRYFKNKVPIYFRGDSTLLNETFGLKKIIRTIFLKWVYQHIDFAFFVGSQNKLYYLRHGIKMEQLFFAPHAVDNKRFSENNTEFSNTADEWKMNLNISKDEIVFLYAGKLESVKNVELIIKVANKLKELPIQIIIVGNGKLEDELKHKAETNNKIHFLEFKNQSEMPVVYRLGDVFILPSKSETWGLSINEAMACGKAVLVSNKCGCAIDLVQDGKNGYIFNSGDEMDLLRKIKLMLDKRELQKMGEYSEKMISRWTINHLAYQIENTFLKECSLLTYS